MRVRLAAAAAALVFVLPTPASGQDRYEYLVLATTRTSTMEREMNEAAEQGYRFEAVMGGDRESGDTELVAIMERDPSPARRHYRVLATSATSTLQGGAGGGRDGGLRPSRADYLLIFLRRAGDRRRPGARRGFGRTVRLRAARHEPDIDHARGAEPRRSAGIRGRRTDRGGDRVRRIRACGRHAPHRRPMITCSPNPLRPPSPVRRHTGAPRPDPR